MPIACNSQLQVPCTTHTWHAMHAPLTPSAASAPGGCSTGASCRGWLLGEAAAGAHPSPCAPCSCCCPCCWWGPCAGCSACTPASPLPAPAPVSAAAAGWGADAGDALVGEVGMERVVGPGLCKSCGAARAFKLRLPRAAALLADDMSRSLIWLWWLRGCGAVRSMWATGAGGGAGAGPCGGGWA